MKLNARSADGMNFTSLYLLIGVITFWFGFRMLDHAADIRLFKDYLVHWEVGIGAFEAHQGIWPEFTGGNHAAYMEDLSARFTGAGVAPPLSNTEVSYRYQIDGWGRPAENIFVLVQQNRIVLYGLGLKTLAAIDMAVDGKNDLVHGRLIGRIGKNRQACIAQWSI